MIQKQSAARKSGTESPRHQDELARLHARLIELEGMFVRLRGDVAEQVISYRLALLEKEETISAARRREEELQSQLAELREHLRAAQARFRETEQALLEKERLLHQIYTSRGFRLVALAWEMRGTWRAGPRALAWFLIRLAYRRLPPGVQVRAKALWYRARHATLPRAPARDDPGESPARQSDADLRPQYGVGVPGLVSVVLPVYNQATFLRDAIRSVLDQSYSAFELIVVNDGSTDAVESVLNEFADHPRVRILVHERNLSLPQALNSGFRYARGEFWTWTSADNLMLPEQLERHVAFLRQHHDVVMVYSDYLAIDDRGQPLRDPTFRPHNRQPRDAPEVRLPRSTERLNVVNDNFIGPCFMYRAWAGKALGPYDASLLGAEDYDYWMRMNNHFQIAHLGTDEVLYQYRVHSNTLNARAAELGLHDRVERLMALEGGERRRFYAQCFAMYADAPLCQELAGVARCEALDTYGEATGIGKRLVLLTDGDEAVAWIASQTGDKGVFIVLRFDDEAAKVYGLEPAILERIDLFFVQRETGLRRLRAQGRSAFVARNADELLRLSSAAANEALFRGRQDRPDPPAPPPRVYVPTGRRLKVVLQVENFDKGGLEQVVHLLARHLRHGVYEPVIMVLGKVGSLAHRARAEGIDVVQPGRPGNAEAHIDLLKSLAPDIINAHSSWYGSDAINGLRVPWVQTLHNTYVWFTPAEATRCRMAEVQTDAYICVSRNVMKYSDLRLGLDPGRMRVIPNCIDVERFPLREEHAGAARRQIRDAYGFDWRDFVILCSSAFYRHKGQLEAVLALQQVLTQTPHVKLVLLGEPVDQRYVGEVGRAMARLGSPASVVMAGFQADPVGLYCAADAFMLPSYWEGWSLALAEAIAVGLPVIATDVGAAKELLSEGALGVLIRPPFEDICDLHWQNWGMYLERGCREDLGFIRALADAMLFVSRRPWTETELKRSRQVVRDKYTPARMTAAYEKAYLEVWSAPNRHR